MMAGLLSACVNQKDLDTWAGVPVSELDKHPVFLTIPHVKAYAEDGTEIRNYVNGADITSCSSGGVASNQLSMAAYQAFTSCIQKRAACNNIFYIEKGVVQRYVATGTGGARCYTNEAARAGFRGSTNIQ
jgi:hypothetical protein